MDTFMDKLAQKLTAQEMIKANTAADTEEMNRLKAQVKEYNNCLEEMKKANRDLQAINTQMSGMLEVTIAPQVEKLVTESINKLQEFKAGEQDDEKLKQFIEEKLEVVSENVHKECVKVYRNVQAVVVEESGKQAEAVTTAVAGLKGKLSAVLGISIVAMIAAIGSIVFQLLTYLQIL